MALPQHPPVCRGGFAGAGSQGRGGRAPASPPSLAAPVPGATERPWGARGVPLLLSFRDSRCCWMHGFCPQTLVILVGGLPIPKLKPSHLGGTQHLSEGRVPLRRRMKPVSYLLMGGGLIPSGPAVTPAPFSPPFTLPALVLLPASGPSSSTLRCPCPASASPEGPRYPSGSLAPNP